MTTSRSKPEPLKALRQWEKDTGSPASATEGNAFIDGFLAGRKFEAKPIRLKPREQVFILEVFQESPKGNVWDRSLHFPGFYTEKAADAIIAFWPGLPYRKREIEYA